MKTSKLFELAEKNPDGMRFTRKGAISYCTFKFKRSGEIECEQYPDRVITPYLTDEWELVREPVDFMTAVKAFTDGKNIKCEFPDSVDRRTTTNYFEQGDSDEKGVMKYDSPVLTFYKIALGKWYIEE